MTKESRKNRQTSTEEDMKKKKVLLFIGSARTGSTLLGQILNYHPECLISNEERLVNKVVEQGIKLETALEDVRMSATRQFKSGLESDTKFGNSIDRYQSKWTAMSDLSEDPDFKKKEIKVIGDKKAGGTTKVYMDKPGQMIKFLEGHPNVYLLQIIRNPISAAISLMKSHRFESFEKACKEIIEKTYSALELSSTVSNQHYIIYYEDLLTNPQYEMGKVLSWLNLECSNSWLEKISVKVAKYEPEDYPDKYFRVAEKIMNDIGSIDHFKRYGLA